MATLTRKATAPQAPQAPQTDTSAAALATATAPVVSKFDNYSEAEVDASMATLIAADKGSNKARAENSRDLMLLVGRKFQLNATFSGEDMALRYDGAERVKTWSDATKERAFSEWKAIGEAARKVPQRFNSELWDVAGGKDKFRTVCRAIVRNPAATKEELTAAIDADKRVQSDGDKVESAIKLLAGVSADNFPAIVEAVKFLQEVRREDVDFVTTAEKAKAAKSKSGPSLADKIAMAEKAKAVTQ